MFRNIVNTVVLPSKLLKVFRMIFWHFHVCSLNEFECQKIQKPPRKCVCGLHCFCTKAPPNYSESLSLHTESVLCFSNHLLCSVFLKRFQLNSHQSWWIETRGYFDSSVPLFLSVIRISKYKSRLTMSPQTHTHKQFYVSTIYI